MGYQDFKELRVWRESKELAVKIYDITNNQKLSKEFGLKEQIRKSAISIPSNVAEGYERNSDKDFVRFLLIAKGSLSELRTQLEIAQEIGCIDSESFKAIDDQCCKIGAMLTKLIKYRRSDLPIYRFTNNL